MIRKNLILCLAASLFIATPMEADAAQISLALAGGITSSLDESSTSDEQIANVLDEVVKNNYTDDFALFTGVATNIDIIINLGDT